MDALLRPAQPPRVGALAASDHVVMFQAPVEARYRGPPADEALGRLWDLGGREDLEGNTGS